MGSQYVLWLHFIFLSMFMVATTCLGPQNLTASCHERERRVLLKFKYSVKDEFNMLSSWVGVDCCSWDRVLCDGAGRVVGLHLRGNAWGLSSSCWLTGTATSGNGDLVNEKSYLLADYVTSSLGDMRLLTYLDFSSLADLRHLKYIDLSGNDFQGRRIPEFIGSLKQLSYLNLSNSGFSGHIPHHIGNLSNLKVLDLSTLSDMQLLETNDMSWISGLLSLEYLDLYGVNISGAKNRDMVFYMIPSVIHLSLSCCGLSYADLAGPHLNFSRTLPNIKYLQLKDNAIEGRFPSVIANMSSLVSLDLSGNLLNSSIPFMPSLLKLDLSNSVNIGLIDHIGIWRQCNLKELIVSSSDLKGAMIGPSTNESICSRYALEMLDLSWNELSGSIPKSLGKLTCLRALHLESNTLIGPIPEALGRLRFLEVLDLYSNQLDGPIPETFGSLTALTYLNLQNNQLTGPIPTSLGRLNSLLTFVVSSNMLNGTIPVSIGQLSKLVELDVSNNSLEGVVSEAHFANLSMLKYLYTGSNNKLILNISHEWIPPFQLDGVYLSSCRIANGFPHWLQTQRKLTDLELSNASLYGLLPTWLRKMRTIYFLNLSHNKFSGSLLNLPISEHTHYFLIQENLFNGSIPRSLCKGTELRLFDVSRNVISGDIPDCLQNLQQMSVLILSSNRLSGVLSTSLGNISSLVWLKLNDNKLSGKLPEDLRNLTSLKVLDLGNNEFSGNIPKWIGENLTNLIVLRLHENNFTGTIPQSLCKCSNLQILDVAHNKLTGSIPHCFGELIGMIKASQGDILDGSSAYIDDIALAQVMKGIQLEYTKTLGLVYNMDLSSNKLIGQIPLEITKLILLVGLNLSHNHLNGSIPDTIGNMKELNSLDFSDNQFTGMIPSSMAALNFLSCLNLSHNNLSGRIPTGNQLQTLTEPSVYAGNRDLCGYPLPNNCSNHENPPTTSKNIYKESNEPKNLWFYLDITCGFATGFWGIIGVLLFKKQWRHKLFMIAEVTKDKVYVAVAVRFSMIKNGKEDK